MGFKFKAPRIDLADFGRSIDLTSSKNRAKLGKATQQAIAQHQTVQGLFVLGGAVNQATGGKTTTYNASQALSGRKPAPTYSTATQALSGYQGATPNQGTWRAPVANRSTTRFAGEVVSATVKDVVAPTANAVSEGLFGVKLTTLAWIAAGGGAAFLVAPPLIERALKA
jgi:hypothetical protein